MQTSNGIVLPKSVFGWSHPDRPKDPVSTILSQVVRMDVDNVYRELVSQPSGLSTEEARKRLQSKGHNVLAKDQSPGFGVLVSHAILNPLVLQLAGLSFVSFATSDCRAGTMTTLMILLGDSGSVCSPGFRR